MSGGAEGEQDGHRRESSDRPILNAFCLVAPSVRLRAFAILAAGDFLLAIVLRVRTSAALQEIRLRFLGMYASPCVKSPALYLIFWKIQMVICDDAESLFFLAPQPITSKRNFAICRNFSKARFGAYRSITAAIQRDHGFQLQELAADGAGHARTQES